MWQAMAFLRLATAQLCLPEAIPFENRKNLSEGVPLGVVRGGWGSSLVSGAVHEILLEEVLGYHLKRLGHDVLLREPC